jgi:MFS superfamily sulfate permease-like transporter
MDDLDFTGSAVLARVLASLARDGIAFVACDIQQPVIKQLELDGLLETIGAEHVYGDTDDVIKAYKTQVLGEDPNA